jgi:hypothetical protein
MSSNQKIAVYFIGLIVLSLVAFMAIASSPAGASPEPVPAKRSAETPG